MNHVLVRSCETTALIAKCRTFFFSVLRQPLFQTHTIFRNLTILPRLDNIFAA